MLFMKLIISSIILKHLQKIKLKNGYYHKKRLKINTQTFNIIKKINSMI